MKRFFYIPFICAAFFSCKFDAQREDFTVPQELLGKWGVKKQSLVVVQITNTTITTGGISFILQDVEYKNDLSTGSNKYLLRQSGTIKTSSPGKPGVFCGYTINFTNRGTVGKLELTGQMDGSTIFYGPLSQILEKLD
ncbi:MAG: hypothetical protein LBG72_10570 [Spirochaetaceae bacterium]|jgi:hypothetical protein|nr:hypothetical protein [Spirochaetaceae bacterium]